MWDSLSGLSNQSVLQPHLTTSCRAALAHVGMQCVATEANEANEAESGAVRQPCGEMRAQSLYTL